MFILPYLTKGSIVLLAQLFSDSTVKILTDAGAVTVLAIGIIFMAYALLQTQRNKSKDEAAENSRLDKLIDSLLSVFTELKSERSEQRKVISDNSETQRLVVAATNEQTGEVRLLRTDFKSYQQLQTETVQNMRDELVSFKGEVQDSINKMLEQITVTNDFVEQAVNEHQVIIDNGKTIIDKVDHLIALLPPPVHPTPPPLQVVTSPVEKTAESAGLEDVA